MNNLFVIAVLLPIVCAPMLLRADIVFSNVTGTGTVSNGAPICRSGAAGCPVPDSLYAEEFTPAANYTLTDAQVLVAAVGSINPGSFDLFLDSNSSGVPGSEIEQIGSGLTATTTSPGSLITAIATPITLVSGTPYWLVLAPATSDSILFWSNGGSPAVPDATSGGVTWSALGTNTFQFQIDGNPISPVPEPSDFALLAGILTLFYGARWRGRRAF
jgi:hypothetical protein